MAPARISKTLGSRLPAYLTYLNSLPGEDPNVSATAIAQALGMGEVQVRKDLAKISGEGRRRTGRSRDQLVRDIRQYLDCTSSTASVLVGADLPELELPGSILACFDLSPSRKRSTGGMPIYSINRLESFCKCYDVRIGIVAVPAEDAQAVCDGLIACGIQAIWNCAGVPLRVPEHIELHIPEVPAACQ